MRIEGVSANAQQKVVNKAELSAEVLKTDSGIKKNSRLVGFLTLYRTIFFALSLQRGKINYQSNNMFLGSEFPTLSCWIYFIKHLIVIFKDSNNPPLRQNSINEW